LGDKVLAAVKGKDTTKAQESYYKAEELSKSVLSHLDKVISAVEEQSKKGVEVLRSADK
jgi:hypothetical protein